MYINILLELLKLQVPNIYQISKSNHTVSFKCLLYENIQQKIYYLRWFLFTTATIIFVRVLIKYCKYAYAAVMHCVVCACMLTAYGVTTFRLSKNLLLIYFASSMHSYSAKQIFYVEHIQKKKEKQVKTGFGEAEFNNMPYSNPEYMYIKI